MRLLGVFAHPDDETFCVGGTLAKYIATGAEAMVASFTKGDAGQIRDASIATRRTIGQVRERELRQACEHLGVQHVRCLDYGDGTLKDIDFRTLVGDVVRIIREYRPDVVFTFGEEGAYGHPDHITIGAATTEACQVSGESEEFPEQIAQGLTPYAPSWVYHSQFPRNRLLLMDHLVQWLNGLDTRFRGTLDFVQGLTLFANETNTLGYNSDHIQVAWYPPGLYIIEQGEPGTSLFLILSGKAKVVQETASGDMIELAQRGPGEFVGELGLAYGQPRMANVIALDSVTCLVFSPGEPSAFAGRGESGQNAFEANELDPDKSRPAITTRIDVTDYVAQKIAAISSHRSQYRVSVDMFPEVTLKAMLGQEYFVRVYPPVELETSIIPFDRLQ